MFDKTFFRFSFVFILFVAASLAVLYLVDRFRADDSTASITVVR